MSDDGLLRWALYEALTAVQYRVLTCSNEARARELVPQVDVDFALAVIDDEAWPITRSGRTWLHQRWPSLPIVVLAHPGQGLEHRLEELGIDDVILKPFDVPHLVQTVERLTTASVRTSHHAEQVKAS